MLRKYVSLLLFLFAILFTVTGCDDLFINEDEEHFDVYYYPPGGEVMHLGDTKGIKNCRLMVQSKARAMGKKRQSKDYVCCLIKGSSSCAKRME